jgi:hypothetical protein
VRLARRLSTHQQAVLIQVLMTFPQEHVGVCYLPSAAGARAYAEEFLTVFKAIGWIVDHAERVENLAAVPGGVAIVVKNRHLPPSAEALRDALRIYGIEAEIARDETNLCASRNLVLAITRA